MTYTQLVVFSLIVTAGLNFFLKTKLFSNRKYWIFIVFVILLQTIVDNYLNGRWWNNVAIVGPYNSQFYSGIKLWHTPLENYFFGLSLITMNVIIFEATKKLWKKKVD